MYNGDLTGISDLTLKFGGLHYLRGNYNILN